MALPDPMPSRPRFRPLATDPKPAHERRCAVYCDVNLTPILQPNPYFAGKNGDQIDAKGNLRWVVDGPAKAFLIEGGAVPTTTLYHHTLNRMPIYSSPIGNEGRYVLDPIDPKGLDWSREKNIVDPVDLAILNAAGQLAARPDYFHPTPFKPGGLVICDYEDVRPFSDLTIPRPDNQHERSPLAQRLAALRLMTEMLRRIRQGAGGFSDWQPVAHYADLWWLDRIVDPRNDEPEIRAALAEYAEYIAAPVACLYFWGVPAANPGYILGEEEKASRYIRQTLPQFAENKIASVCPWYAVGSADVHNGKVVPFADFKRQVDDLVADGWDLWVFGDGKIDEVVPHLKYVVGYQR